jgi:Ribonuclease G/E
MIEREGRSLRGNIVVQAHPSVADYISQQERFEIEYLEKRFKRKINVSPITSFHIEEYEIFGKK